jgi:hypothetical protein
MTHSHAHEHYHDPSAYYTQQLCTIGICGGLGGVAIMLYARDLLKYVLVAQFHVMVLWSGIALVTLVAIRAVALWFSAGKAMPDHDHHHHEHHDCGHGHLDCGHEHAVMADPHHHPAAAASLTTAPGGLALVTDAGHHQHHDSDQSHEHGHFHAHNGNGHDHDHTWDSLKFIVLLVPIVLYFLNIPSSVLSAAHAGFNDELADAGQVEDKDFDANLDFKELDGANLVPERRKYYEGKRCRLKGQFAPSGRDSMFTLVRYRMRCCAADAVPLQAVILVDNSQVKELKELPEEEKKINPAEYKDEWVEVTGQIQFRQIRGREDYVTVIVVRPTKDRPLSKLIERVPPESNPYL